MLKMERRYVFKRRRHCGYSLVRVRSEKCSRQGQDGRGFPCSRRAVKEEVRKYPRCDRAFQSVDNLARSCAPVEPQQQQEQQRSDRVKYCWTERAQNRDPYSGPQVDDD